MSAYLLQNDILRETWNRLQQSWFPQRTDLLDYAVSWSSRPQKRTLASCNISRKKVVVAREMNDPRWLDKIEPLLYHEMCHAVLGEEVRRVAGRRMWHGREFKALEACHPGIPELDLWVKTRGWEFAVRSDRSRRSQMNRRQNQESSRRIINRTRCKSMQELAKPAGLGDSRAQVKLPAHQLEFGFTRIIKVYGEVVRRLRNW